MQFRFDCTQYHPWRPKFRPSQAKSCEKQFFFIIFTKSNFLIPKSRFLTISTPFLFIHKRFPSILTIKSWYFISNFDPRPKLYHNFDPKFRPEFRLFVVPFWIPLALKDSPPDRWERKAHIKNQKKNTSIKI